MKIITEHGSRDLETIYDEIIESMDVRGLDPMGIYLRVKVINDDSLTLKIWRELLKFYKKLLWAKKQGWINHPELKKRLELHNE